MFRGKVIIIAVLCSILLSGCNAFSQKNTDDSAKEAQSEIDKDSAQARREELWKYRYDDNVNQILLVTHTTGSDAKVEFYQKNRDENNTWSLMFRSDAYVGVNGMGDTQEGSGKSPLGDFGIREAFGIRDNPGTALKYIQVKPTTYACDEDSEYYNTIIDIEETGHKCNGEEMYLYTPEYNYGIATDTNPENVYPNGSALFLHCKGTKPYTLGCVGLDEEDMVTVIRCAEPGMRVFYSEMYK